MNKKPIISIPQFRISVIPDKNNKIHETIYEFDRRYIKEEFSRIISEKIDNWKQEDLNWITGSDKIEITRDYIRYSIRGSGKFTPLLNNRIKKKSIDEILETAINITEKYSMINSRGLLNRSIKSSNLLTDGKSLQIVLSPVNIFCDIIYSKDELPGEEIIFEELNFLAPEHFNNEEVFPGICDEIYSLGVLFYDLFTGIKPFRATEYDELLYSHLFMIPARINTVNSSITPGLSEVIAKMLNKSPFDRYITYSGLLYDLGQCRKVHSDSRKVKIFIPGSRDWARSIIIPDKLYGRDNYSMQLIEIFNKTKTGLNNTVFISGPSGIGKTTLINRTIRPLITTSGIFITGKCESSMKNIPYEPLIKAIEQLIKPILIDNQDIKNIWKESILNAVGSNGRIITELIPSIIQIIGEQPPLPEISGEESRNRINTVMSKFLNVFISSTRIFVMFIDDIQWIDNASLSLLKQLLTQKAVKSFLLITAYRDNEISEFHSLNVFINDLRVGGIHCNEYTLNDLDLSNTNQIFSDTLKVDKSESMGLSELAHKCTNGNPLFLKEFLFTLFHKGLIHFSEDIGWQWDIDKIAALYESENAVNSILTRMTELPAMEASILKYTACLNTEFTADVVSEITGYSEADVNRILTGFIIDGFLKTTAAGIRFAHDSIHEAAASIIRSEDERSEINRKIGLYLLRTLNIAERDDNIYIIASHLKSAFSKLDVSGKKTLIDICLIAGEKAKKSAAYDLALTCYYAASDAAEAIDSDRTLKAKLYHESFICEYTSGNFEKAYDLFNTFIQSSESDMERMAIYRTNILLLMNISKPKMAIEIGLIGLKKIGIKIPHNPGVFRILKEYFRVKYRLMKMSDNDILSMKKSENQKMLAAMEIMHTLCMPAYANNRNLLKLLSLMMTNMTIEYGLCRVTPFALISLGVTLGSGRGKFLQGYRFALLALEMLDDEINRNSEVKCIVDFFFAAFHSQWVKPYDYSIPFFKKSHELGSGHGVLYYTRLNDVFHTASRFLKGDRIDVVIKESLEHLQNMHMTRNAHWYGIMAMLKNFSYLQDGDSDFFFRDTKINDSDLLNGILKLEVKQPLHWFTVFRSKGLLIFRKYNEALKSIDTAESIIDLHYASSIIAEHRFIQSIAIINRTIKKDIFSRIKYSMKLRLNIRYLKKCSDLCPENFRHKYYLTLAERDKTRGRLNSAIKYYDLAIQSAEKTGLVHDLAFIYDLYASFCRESGMEILHKAQLKLAKYYYNEWGAGYKVEELEKEYPFLTESPEGENKADTPAADKPGLLLPFSEEIIGIIRENNIPEKIKKLSHLFLNYCSVNRVILLQKDEKIIIVKSAMNSEGFTYHDNGEPPENLMINRFALILRELDNSELYFSGLIQQENNIPESFCAAIPLTSIRKNEGYIVLQKFRFPFNDEEKTLIRVLSEMIRGDIGIHIPVKHKTPAIKKDIQSSNLNDIIRSRLLKVMEQEKIFLTEELTLYMLAKEIDIQPQVLSEYINNSLNMNFNSFINKYRIDEAKRILKEEPERPVLNIAYDVGFNSISVFYNAFLKCEGIPPAKYRKNLSS